MANTGLTIEPMDQFIISPLFGGGENGEVFLLTFTNSTLWMMIVLVATSLFFVIGSQGRALVPTRIQSMVEVIYEFLRGMIRDTAGEEGLRYFPYIFTLFVFIVGCNVFGLIPYSFTVTSHLAITATLAIAVFVAVTAIGFARQGVGFLNLFVPKDCPAPLLIILVPIEVISYFVRPVSHSIRLGANMLAGHAVMKVFAGFVFPLGVIGILPATTMVGIYAFELLVAVVQAYIFTILTCIYLNDALHGH